MEIEPRPIFSYADKYTRRFLFTAVVQEGLEEVLLPRARRPAAWRRKIEVGHLFYNQGFSLDEIGEKFGFTRQRAAQLKDGYIKGLHQRANPALQNGFPLRMIPLGKNDLDLGIRKSRSQEGHLAKALDDIRQGKTPEQAVANNVTSPKLSKLRRKLRSYGFQVAYVIRTPHIIAEIIAKLSVTDDYDETANLLKEINHPLLYGKCIKGPNPVIVSLSAIAAEAGFHGLTIHMKDFFDSLTSVGLPVQILRTGRKQPKQYYFLSTRHREEAKQLLLLDQTLAEYL